MNNMGRGIVLGIAVLACAASSKKPSEKQSKSVEKEQAVMNVTVAEILADHDKNPLRWDERFRGKVVAVSGVIKTIEHAAITDDPVVTLESAKPAEPDPDAEWSFDRVTCYLADSQVAKATQLEVGKPLTVKGNVKGWSMGADLSPCVLP